MQPRLLVSAALLLSACAEPRTAQTSPAPALAPTATMSSEAAQAPAKRVLVVSRSSGDTLLFTAERLALEPVAELVFRRQQQLPLAPLSASELADLHRLQREGRVRENGPVCKHPPTLERVAFAQDPELAAGVVRSHCDSVCKVSLEVQATRTPFLGIGGGDTLYQQERVVAQPESATGFNEALLSIVLPLPQPVARKLGDVRGAASTEGSVELVRALLGPSFSDGFVQLPKLGCQPGLYRALIELDRAGRVVRCESDRGGGFCDVCAGFESTPQTSGAAPRRALVELGVRQVDRGGVFGMAGVWLARAASWLRVAGPAAEDDAQAVLRMNLAPACIRPKRAATPADWTPDEVSANVFVSRKEDGSVETVRFEDEKGFAEGNEACFEEVIRSVGLPCAVPGQTELALRIETRRERR